MESKYCLYQAGNVILIFVFLHHNRIKYELWNCEMQSYYNFDSERIGSVPDELLRWKSITVINFEGSKT